MDTDMDTTDDFESFEFIDYTASGPWERFIVQIEDCLKQWGLVHNSLGVFNPNVMPSSTETTLDLDREIAQAIGEDYHGGNHTHNNISRRGGGGGGRAGTRHGSATTGPLSSTPSIHQPESKVYQHEETITFNDVSYQLCYRYHPAKARMASGVEHIDLDFLPLALEGIQHHELHRWTSLTHILVLSPTAPGSVNHTNNINHNFSSNNNNNNNNNNTGSGSTSSSSSSSSTIIDLGTAKLLLSSFAIAFQNTGCNIPVFVPTGQPRSQTYNGLSIQPQLSYAKDTEFGLDETAEDQAIEVRFTTVLVPYPPAQYTNLSGILDLFIERMGIEHDDAFLEDSNQQHHHQEGPGSSLEGEEEGGGGYSHSVKEQIFVSALFTYQIENWHDEDWRQWTDKSHKQQQEQQQQQRQTERSKNAPPRLPIGPLQDPLKSLQLVARFDMDATQANIWNIKVAFKPDEYGLLSGILEDTISSWSMDASLKEAAEAEESKNIGKENQHLSSRHSYTSLLRKGARLIQGSIAMVDSTDVDNIVDTLFTEEEQQQQPSSTSTLSESSVLLSQSQPPPPPAPLPAFLARSRYVDSSRPRVLSASELMSYLPHATTVPFNSFLWRMLDHLVDVISPNSHISYPTSFMGFMKAVWSEVLKGLEDHWQDRKMIPLIDIFGTPLGDDSMYGSEMYGAVQDNDEEDNEEQERNTTAAIDLRFNLVHQKLCMINCCIARDLKEEQKRVELEQERERQQQQLSEQRQQQPPTPKVTEEQMQHQQSSAATVPLTGSSDAALSVSKSSDSLQSSDAASEDEDQELTPSPSSPPSRSPVLSPSSVPVFDDSKTVNADETVEQGQDEEDLNLSNIPCPEPERTVLGEGILKAFQGLTLLETGAKLMIPQLQESGFMTEDMIQEREMLFEELGSTSEGAKTMVQIQSAHLVSDMQAFKAANPGCVLGDFIRWHSPKDWDETHQQMSSRMAENGNLWQTLWNSADAIPASQQTPLFDQQLEAEKALKYLKGLSADRLFSQLLPTLFILAYDTLVSHPVANVNRQCSQALQDLGQHLRAFPWTELIHSGRKEVDLKPILENFRHVESIMGKVMALVRKFPDQFDLVERIVEGAESVVDDGPERSCVQDVFSVTGFLESAFPKPICREFVMETFDPVSSTVVSRSASPSMSASGPGHFVSSGDMTGWHARPLQRRMYSCFRESEVRIVEAIAKDGMFM
ncbi:Rab3 GTPase-activating protein catalytic subunit [Gryganskiella cystojenkinii]|nr:Rab3 GTPase-activating protein catalytic subunit [Gryganskiella cystojenkinii]